MSIPKSRKSCTNIGTRSFLFLLKFPIDKSCEGCYNGNFAPERPTAARQKEKEPIGSLLLIDPRVIRSATESNFNEALTGEVAERLPRKNLCVLNVMQCVGVFNIHFCIHERPPLVRCCISFSNIDYKR